ncbi:MAG TPA: FecR domain-containing protein, partial [Candidatus Omnitrophota bacterium]|nr:FecR domain-containing protein [Candidatus Omnitrophota bacterium]
EILTASNASCIVGIGGDEKSAVQVNPDSRAVIHSYDPVHVDLQSGKLFALVRGLRKGSDFRVSTPTAVASARGTGWGQDSSAVDVFEENVNVNGKAGGEEDVEEGKGLKVNPDGTLGETYEVSEKKIEEWNIFKEDAEEAIGEDEDDLPGDDLDEIKEDSSESDDQDDIDESLEPEEEKDERGEQFLNIY